MVAGRGVRQVVGRTSYTPNSYLRTDSLNRPQSRQQPYETRETPTIYRGGTDGVWGTIYVRSGNNNPRQTTFDPIYRGEGTRQGRNEEVNSENISFVWVLWVAVFVIILFLAVCNAAHNGVTNISTFSSYALR